MSAFKLSLIRISRGVFEKSTEGEHVVDVVIVALMVIIVTTF